VRDRAIHQKLDRLDEAFLYSESIDLTSYSRTLEGAFVDELALLQPTPGLHAASEGSHPSRVGAAPCGSERAVDGTGTRGQGSCSSRKESRTTEIDSIEPA